MEADQLLDKMVDVIDAIIPISTDTSDAVDLYGTTVVGLETPAALDGTSFSFLGSIDKGQTFKTIKDSADAAIAGVVSADGSYPMDARAFAPYDQIKIVSNATETAERIIKVKPFAL